MISEIASKIILQILLIAAFIGSFFFTYGAYIERTVFKQQIDYIVTELVGEFSSLVPQTMVPTIRTQINNLVMPDMSQQDAQTAANNNKLLMVALPILFGLALFGLVFAGIMSLIFSFSFVEILLLNLFALVAVAVTEFVFLTFVGKNYKSADPNYVKKSVFEVLRDFSNS